MTRAVAEWIGKHDDSPVPPRVRLRIWERVYGFCQGPCGRYLGDGKPFHADHIVALINGGENREGNLQVLCDWCHKDKTKADITEKSRTYKKRARHVGIKLRTGRSFPTNRDGRWKKKISGEVVRR